MFCSNCGRQLPDSAKFCPDCGQPIKIPGKPIVTEPEAEPVVEPEPVPVAAPEPVTEPEPVKAPEPEPVKAPEPEPVKAPEPEPVAEPEPEKREQKKSRYTPAVVPEQADEPAFEPDPEPVVPEENRPLGPWAYFGYGLLFSIPVIGFILLIVFSFAGKNVNRKNFARSYWCWVILVIALILIGVVILLTGILRGLTNGLAAWLSSIGLTWLAGFFG